MVVSVGIDVSKDKHDCFIVSSDGDVLADVFTISNSSRHRQQEAQPELRLDGKDAGQTAHTDRVGLHSGADRDHRRHSGTGHAAHQRGPVFHVHTEQRRLGDAQITGDAGRDVYLLGTLVLSLQDRHRQHRRALRDIGQRDHRPEDGAFIQVHQLRVDGVGHVVQTGHHDGRVDKAEDRGKQPFDIGGSPIYTTEAMASPIFQPMGPTTVWATITAGTSEQKGTTIMLTTSGQIFLKNFSRYTSTKPAKMAAMTWP